MNLLRRRTLKPIDRQLLTAASARYAAGDRTGAGSLAGTPYASTQIQTPPSGLITAHLSTFSWGTRSTKRGRIARSAATAAATVPPPAPHTGLQFAPSAATAAATAPPPAPHTGLQFAPSAATAAATVPPPAPHAGEHIARPEPGASRLDLFARGAADAVSRAQAIAQAHGLASVWTTGNHDGAPLEIGIDERGPWQTRGFMSNWSDRTHVRRTQGRLERNANGSYQLKVMGQHNLGTMKRFADDIARLQGIEVRVGLHADAESVMRSTESDYDTTAF